MVTVFHFSDVVPFHTSQEACGSSRQKQGVLVLLRLCWFTARSQALRATAGLFSCVREGGLASSPQ